MSKSFWIWMIILVLLVSTVFAEETYRVVVKVKEPQDKHMRGASIFDIDEAEVQKQDNLNAQAKVINRVTGYGGAGVASGSEDVQVVRQLHYSNTFSAEVTAEGLERLRNDPDVELVSDDMVAEIFLAESVEQINATDAWGVQYDNLTTLNLTGKGQTVCIIDSGIDEDHPYLVDKVVGQYCLCSWGGGCCPNGENSDTSVQDDHGHGTHVAGIIASQNETYKGVAPDANLVVIKTQSSTGYGEFSDIAAGIQWCIDNRTKFNISVISLSLGSSSDYRNSGTCDLLTDNGATEVNTAANLGMIVSTATGNNGNKTDISFPACTSGAIAVSSVSDGSAGSCGAKDSACSSAQSGVLTDVYAPGDSIISLSHTGGIVADGGTSMACPHVSGVAAIIKQYNSSINNTELKKSFNNTDVFVTDGGRSYPRIDFLKVLDYFDNTPPDLTFVNPTPENNTFSHNHTLFVNITSSETLKFAMLELNGTNYSMDGYGRNWYVNLSDLSGKYSYRVRANDTFGNEGFTGSRIRIINYSAPSITGWSPTGYVSIEEPNDQLFSINFTSTLASVISWFRNSTLVGSVPEYNFTGNYSAAGVYNVTVLVNDTYNISIHSWVFEVNNTQTAPVLNNITNLTVAEDTELGVVINVTDLDGDNLVYTINDTTFSINNSGYMNGTPPLDYFGLLHIELNVTDGVDNETAYFFVNVTPVNDAPVMNDVNNIAVSEGETVFLNSSGQLNATDVDSVALNYSFSSPFNSTGHWVTTYDDNGTTNVTVTVSDGGLVDHARFNVTVSNVNRLSNVTINRPLGGEIRRGVMLINITAEDPDGNRTVKNASFSYYNMTHWNLIGVDINNTDNEYNISWNTTGLNGKFLLKANVTDGENYSAVVLSSNITIDNIEPSVEWYSPNGTNISYRTNISLNWSENVNVSTINKSTINIRSSEAVLGLYTYVGNVSLFNPTMPLQFNTTYIVNVSGVVDLAGNVANKYFNFTTGLQDTDSDGIPDVEESGAGADMDNDGINNTVDKVKGSITDVNTVIPSFNITINSSSNVSRILSGELPVNITNGTGSVLEFTYDFTNVLDLTNLTVVKNQNTSVGSLIVRGLSGNNKTLYVDRMLGSNGVCVKDVIIQDVSEISADCKGENEYFVPVNGTNGGYNCTDIGGQYRISGLTHSGVEEQNDTDAPQINSISTSSSGTTTVTVTLTVETDEPASCRYGTADAAYASLGSGMTGTITHSGTIDYTSDSSGTYYVRCNDTQGNVMNVSNSTAYTADIESAASSSSGGGGGGGGSSTVSDTSTSVQRSLGTLSEGDERRVRISAANLAVSYVSFEMVSKATLAKIRVNVADEEEIVKKIDDAYQYFEVSLTNLYSTQMDNIKLRFKVNDTWLEGKDKVSLLRLYGDHWQKLDTDEINSTDKYTEFEAKTPGFSYFAITADEKVIEEAVPVITEPAVVFDDKDEEVPEEIVYPSEIKINETEDVVETEERKLPVSVWILLGVLASLVATPNRIWIKIGSAMKRKNK